MRYLVLSDIHANLEALESVLADAAAHEPWQVLMLGDLVGYGADPNAVIDRLRDLPVAGAIRGNHDRAACGLDDLESFNEVARASAIATARMLSARSREYLRNLPPGPRPVSAFIEICHGAPFDEDAYVFDEMDAVYALRSATRPLCFFGHTHTPFAARLGGDELEYLDLSPGIPVAVSDQAIHLVNPGSVGQPRDGDARAAYAIADDDSRIVTHYRIEYRVERAQQRIREAGLPEALAKRLALGR